jgi:hypothetical protein
MSWCPFAVKMELQPESDAQAAIVPTQFIAHSIAAPWTIERIYEYWRDSTNLESHFGVGYDGRVGQYIGTQTRADANYRANVRAISAETASNLEHTDPWTDAQLDTLVRVMDWAARTHSIPRRKCRSWDDPGFGYHRMYPEWSTGGTACPGDARVKQFNDIIMPRLIAAGSTAPPPEETPVAVTEAEIDAIGAQVVTGANGMKSPDDPTVEWAVSAYLTGTYKKVRALEAAVASLQAKVDALTVGGVDLDALATKVADELAARLAS